MAKMKQYNVKTSWWSLFDHKTPEEARIHWKVIEAKSVKKLLADHEKTQRGFLDGGEIILEVYENGKCVYKKEEVE